MDFEDFILKAVQILLVVGMLIVVGCASFIFYDFLISHGVI